MSFYWSTIEPFAEKALAAILESRREHTEAIREHTEAIREAARTPQRIVHMPGPGERGGHHADSRPAVPAALRQR